MLAPLSNYLGGPGPPSSYAYVTDMPFSAIATSSEAKGIASTLFLEQSGFSTLGLRRCHCQGAVPFLPFPSGPSCSKHK